MNSISIKNKSILITGAAGFIGANLVMELMKAPERKVGEDGLPLPPYAVYNIGNSSPENLLDFVDILQQELVRAGVLPEDYNFDEHKELVPMQAGDVRSPMRTPPH